MKMKTLHAAGVREPAPRTWSNAKVCGNQFFVSGMTAHDGQGKVAGDASMYGQAKTTFLKIQGMVAAAGGGGKFSGKSAHELRCGGDPLP